MEAPSGKSRGWTAAARAFCARVRGTEFRITRVRTELSAGGGFFFKDSKFAAETGGVFGGHIQFEGKGRSTAEILGDANGGLSIFMTGGKYSVTENGNIKFIYSNDVWYMIPSSK